jgi:hypothetical protein
MVALAPTAPLTPGAIRFEVWDYSTVDGGGYCVISRPECCDHKRRAVGGVFTDVTRVAAYSVDAVEACERGKWDVPLDVRYCACGCLRGTTAADRPVFTVGQAVTYHGSLVELHGPAFFYGPCGCRNDDCTGAELETEDGHVINHARYGSYSPR